MVAEAGTPSTGSALLLAIEKRSSRWMGAFNPHGLSSLLWGFAKLGWEPGAPFLTASEEAALQSLPKYAPRELSGLLLAYCRMSHQPGTPLGSTPRSSIFIPNTAWSTSQVPCFAFYPVTLRPAAHPPQHESRCALRVHHIALLRAPLEHSCVSQQPGTRLGSLPPRPGRCMRLHQWSR